MRIQTKYFLPGKKKLKFVVPETHCFCFIFSFFVIRMRQDDNQLSDWQIRIDCFVGLRSILVESEYDEKFRLYLRILLLPWIIPFHLVSVCLVYEWNESAHHSQGRMRSTEVCQVGNLIGDMRIRACDPLVQTAQTYPRGHRWSVWSLDR